jgi:hypothetical protein
MGATENRATRTPLRELARVFLRLGAVSFGGPAAHVEVARAHVVDVHQQLVHLAHLASVDGLDAPTADVRVSFGDFEVAQGAEGSDAHSILGLVVFRQLILQCG